MKSPLKLPRDQVEALRPGDVRLYLSSRGWVPQPDGPSPRALTYRHSAFPEADLLIPIQREVGDFVLRMADVVVALSAIERRSAWEVLNDLSGPPGDIFRLRVIAPDATLGNLPLEQGIRLLQGGRDLLLAAAQSAHQPRALHPQKVPRDVREFLVSCRLGQTERGSFVATIIAPIPPEIPGRIALCDDETRTDCEPYPRRVTTGMMTALGVVSESIQSGRPDRLLEAVEKGVSANLCEALKAMKPAGDQSRLDISVSWARIRSHVPDHVPQAVTFPEESFAFIEEAGRQLRMRAFAKRERYRGKLLAAQRVDRPLFRDVVGKVVFAADVGGLPARVKVDLNQDDLRRACAALAEGKYVAVTGIIRRDVKTREYEISEPSDFEVIDDA